MILQGNSRGGASDLAAHLMKPENEHIELHELRGFASNELMGALNEAYAVSRGTRCKQFLYSLSLNPPLDQNVSTAAFEAAIEQVEEKLGLSGQPRAIVFHEKKGRRHAHCVWSRINVSEMKAVQMSFDHEKLQAVSRELFLEYGWKIPEGLAKREHSNPRTFTLADWQQARRIKKHPHAVQRDFEDAWAISDSRAALIHALDERGYRVALGRKNRPVAVDMNGEVFSIARQAKKANIKTKDVRFRLGDVDGLPDVETVKAEVAEEMRGNLDRLKAELEIQFQQSNDDFELQRAALVEKQRRERLVLADKLDKRRVEENRNRQNRFRKGMAGLWDRLNGTHRRIKTQNEMEAEACAQRDAAMKDGLIFQHLGERQRLSLFRLSLRRDYDRTRKLLERDRLTFGTNPQTRGGPEFGL
ncbi:MAG: relaxase/mobilization nuclease domain-containing protein [Pseudomonadota bacterium]